MCQNALSLHCKPYSSEQDSKYTDWSTGAYLQIEKADLIALSIGINREPPPNCAKGPELLKVESRTWW